MFKIQHIIDKEFLSLFIAIISLIISLISTFYYSRKEKYITVKNNISNYIDQIYDLQRKLEIEKDKKNIDVKEITSIQLQLKHLLHVVIELEGESNLNQPQCRLLAECFDHMLYYDLAEKYWLKVFEYPFLIPELEAEYYRSYAMFLYKIQKKDVGEDVFKKSLSCLMNTTDAHRYINIFTLSIWIKEESIFFDENVLKDNGKQNIVYCYR